MRRLCLAIIALALSWPALADTIGVGKAVYPPGAIVSVTWNNAHGSVGGFDWVCLVTSGSACSSPPGQSGRSWAPTNGVRANSGSLVAPGTGTYQIVYYNSSDPARSTNTEYLRSAAFTVGDPAVCQARDTAAIPFRVLAEIDPPQNDLNARCSDFPISDFLGGTPANYLNTLSQSRKHWFAWANRCTGGPNGGLCDGTNFLNFPGITVSGTFYARPFGFSTVARADACTIAQVQQLLGQESAAAVTVTAAGMVALTTQNPATYFSGGQFLDVCYLSVPGGLLAYLDGIAFDYEVHDNRTTDQAKATLTQLPSIIHAAGKQAILYPDPLPEPHSAITAANGHALLQAFDLVGISGDSTASASGMRAYLDSQIAVYSPASLADAAKIFVEVQLGSGMTGAQLLAINQTMAVRNISALDLFADFADKTLPSGLYWTATRCVVFGIECPP